MSSLFISFIFVSDGRYSKQSFIVDLVFPPLQGAGHEDVEGTEYNEFMFWKEPLPSLPDEATQFAQAYTSTAARSNRRSSREKR